MESQDLTDLDLPMKIKFPDFAASDKTNLEIILGKRRSLRKYTEKGFSELVISRFLWTAQGISSKEGLRTAPSAGAIYPLEIHVIAGINNGIGPGVYRYDPEENALNQEIQGDIRVRLSEAALFQSMIREAPISLVITAIYARITGRYGKRGIRYTYMEAGHVAQNVYLLGVELGIGTCAIGAFDDEEVRKVLKLPANEEPLYILPLGYV